MPHNYPGTNYNSSPGSSTISGKLSLQATRQVRNAYNGIYRQSPEGERERGEREDEWALANGLSCALEDCQLAEGAETKEQQGEDPQLPGMPCLFSQFAPKAHLHIISQTESYHRPPATPLLLLSGNVMQYSHEWITFNWCSISTTYTERAHFPRLPFPHNAA